MIFANMWLCVRRRLSTVGGCGISTDGGEKGEREREREGERWSKRGEKEQKALGP